jgi:signal transduction histidine kinase
VRVRTYGLILLILVGITPLAVYGIMALARAQETSAQQVQEGNRRAARAIAGRIGAYAASERNLIAAIGAAVWHARGAHARQLVLDAYQLDYPHLHDLVVYDASGQVMAGRVPENDAPLYRDFAAEALAGAGARSSIEPAAAGRELFAHTIAIGEPIVIAGKPEGAIVARYDLVGIWPAVDSVRVGKTGVVRLLAHDGSLLAHGDPEERRFVFDESANRYRELVAGALLGKTVVNRQGEEILPALAFVPDFPAIVVVEQSVLEAFADIRSMQVNLVLLAGLAVALALMLGLAFGRRLVQALEALRTHTRGLADDLQRRHTLRTPLVEIQALADALDDMAGALFTEREQTRMRERLTTFARVAAGLAHDLRLPIEAVHSAMDLIAERPGDPAAQRLLGRIREREVPRLKRFIDDLHRLAHKGNLGLEYESVEPRALLEEIRAELAGAPKWYGVTFEIRGSAGRAVLDRGLVRRAIVNLAGNAAEACLALGPGGTVTFELAGDDDVVEFRVSDTGVGLSPERIAALEHSDFQSTKRTTGVGLGLGVVRQVLSAHGGSLTIASKVGVGSVFTIELPRAARPQQRELPDGMQTAPLEPGPALPAATRPGQP